MESKTTEPRWFAEWWLDQHGRNDVIGGIADDVIAEEIVPPFPVPIHEITDGLSEWLADTIEDAWFEWEDEIRGSLLGWAWMENLLNDLYPEEVDRGPHHRVLPTSS